LKAVVKLKNGKIFAYDSIENYDPNEAEGPFIDVLIAGIKNKSGDSKFENITGERTFLTADIYSIELIM
jgi:cell division protein FtsI/penicillin-binding protein 2